jgi:hypothetical protein
VTAGYQPRATSDRPPIPPLNPPTISSKFLTGHYLTQKDIQVRMVSGVVYFGKIAEYDKATIALSTSNGLEYINRTHVESMS